MADTMAFVVEECIILASYGKRTWLPFLAALMLGGIVSGIFLPWLCIPFGAALAFVLWFFRDPERKTPAADNALISPADGKIVEIAAIEEGEHIGGPALKIAIFMSVFDVHVNRSPSCATVEWIRHLPGQFMNAIRSNAGIENEHTLVALRDERSRPLLLNLVAGLVARRIVCALKPGETLGRGERLGMIKFGSRVEVFVPRSEEFHVSARLGQHVKAGRTVLGEWM